MTSQPPLSHHRILELVAPFAARGWHVDLSATDRAERRIVFHPRTEPDADGLPEARVTLVLDAADEERLVVIRQVQAGRPAGEFAGAVRHEAAATPADTLAELSTEGRDAARLLDALAAVPLARQYLAAGGSRAALRQRLATGPPGGPRLVLQGARARVAGLTLSLRLSGVQGYPAELELLRDDGDGRELPEDLLAVLGRRWDRLVAVRRGWLGQVDVPGSEPARSDGARAALGQLLEHLSQTLAEPPQRFHERHRGARWRVALRGSGPIAVGAALVALALVLQRQGGELVSLLGLLANLAPPLLMGLFFMRREMPRLGLPRPPRPLRPEAWAAAEVVASRQPPPGTVIPPERCRPTR